MSHLHSHPREYRKIFLGSYLCIGQKNSRRLELSISKNTARKVGTRSRQCGPKVPGRFAFPSARNPSICSIWRFGKNFLQAIFPEFSRNFPPELPHRPQKQPQPSRVISELVSCQRVTAPTTFIIESPRADMAQPLLLRSCSQHLNQIRGCKGGN